MSHSALRWVTACLGQAKGAIEERQLNKIEEASNRQSEKQKETDIAKASRQNIEVKDEPKERARVEDTVNEGLDKRVQQAGKKAEKRKS